MICDASTCRTQNTHQIHFTVSDHLLTLPVLLLSSVHPETSSEALSTVIMCSRLRTTSLRGWLSFARPVPQYSVANSVIIESVAAAILSAPVPQSVLRPNTPERTTLGGTATQSAIDNCCVVQRCRMAIALLFPSTIREFTATKRITSLDLRASRAKAMD